MPLCTYFVNGTCRFGSKCVNDHLDLKTLLKTEVDSVLNGKQWIFSCFGPFKESQIIPNFIEDKSFEEVRLSFMQSTVNSSTQSYLQNLMEEYNTAVNKMNQLKMASAETLQMITTIYNNSTDPKAQNTTQSAPNPFQNTGSAFGSSQAAASNIFGAPAPSQQSTAMSTASIFGTSNNNVNPFQAQTAQQSSVFGATSSFQQPQQQQAQNNSIFGQSIFASTQIPQQKPSVFSSQVSNPFSQSTGSIFGQAAQQPQTNIFQQPQQPRATNIFQQQAQAVQQSSQQSNIFQQNLQQPSQPTNIFQQPQQPIQQPAQNQNIFAASINMTNQTANVFASPFQQPTATGFSAAVSNPFQSQNQVVEEINENVYSRPEDLSAEEMKEFQENSFTFGNIPTRPPPRNLC